MSVLLQHLLMTALLSMLVQRPNGSLQFLTCSLHRTCVTELEGEEASYCNVMGEGQFSNWVT